MQTSIQQLGTLIETSNKILLINHIRMDGDAWGSLGGLALLLKNMGKEVRAINDCNVPPFLAFLGHEDIIEPELDVADFDPDIIISLDAANTERLGESYIKWKNIFDAKDFIVIDHHISNPSFGNINIINSKASSVCEMMADIVQSLSLESYITPEIATFFYTGLQTDTNMYFTTNTTENTLLAGAKLISWGADFRLPVRECFKKKSIYELKLWEIALKNTTTAYDGKLIYSTISVEDLQSISGIEKKEIGGYLKGFINDILINTDNAKIAFLLYPLSREENKVSMRSQLGYDVNAICQRFGGGGHLQASGFQSMESMKQIEQQLLDEVKKTILS